MRNATADYTATERTKRELSDQCDAGRLGVIAAKARVPEYRLRDFVCADVMLDPRELADVQAILFNEGDTANEV